MTIDNCLVIKRRFINSNLDLSLASVYAPYDSGGRHVLWERLGGLIRNDNEAAWCVLDYFNVIRSLEERLSRVVGDSREDFSRFNQFIDDNLPSCGPNYTWYRGDGVLMSRLDIFLVFEAWILLGA